MYIPTQIFETKYILLKNKIKLIGFNDSVNIYEYESYYDVIDDVMSIINVICEEWIYIYIYKIECIYINYISRWNYPQTMIIKIKLMWHLIKCQIIWVWWLC